MTVAWIHGQNKGDTLLAAQGCYQYEDVHYVTDEFNRGIVEFLINHTDVPVVKGVYYRTDQSNNLAKAKFMPYRHWSEKDWKRQLPGYDKYIVFNPYRATPREAHNALKATRGKKLRSMKVHGIEFEKQPDRIVLSCESWNFRRLFRHWDDLSLPSDNVVELITDMDNAKQTRFRKVVVWQPGWADDFINTAKYLLSARLVIAVSSMTAHFAASLGVPVVMLHFNPYSRRACGMKPFGYVDMNTSDSPGEISRRVREFWETL